MKRAEGRIWVVSAVATMAVLTFVSSAEAQTDVTEQQTKTVGGPAPVAQPVVPVQTVPAAAPPVAVQVAPAQAMPVQQGPTKQTNVISETHSENYMATIAKSVFYGAVAGALVGSAVYFIDRDDVRPVTIAYWGAGGALVGAAAGAVQIAVTESRNERALSYQFRDRKANHDVAFMTTLVNMKF